jgi:hypothetical protein
MQELVTKKVFEILEEMADIQERTKQSALKCGQIAVNFVGFEILTEGAMRSSDKLVNLYWITQCHIPKCFAANINYNDFYDNKKLTYE